jgi:hypothetical protein
MKRHESATSLDPAQQVFFLLRRDFWMIGLNNQNLETGEHLGIECVERLRVLKLNAVARHCWLQLPESIRRAMVPLIA